MAGQPDETIIALVLGKRSTPAEDPVELPVPIIKFSDDDERFVLGVVLEPDVFDSQADTVSKGEIRQAAHKFLEEFGTRGLMHRANLGERVQIVESYIAPQDLTVEGVKIRKGTWLMGWHIADDQVWRAVKSGELTGFSIGGSARRVPVEV